MKLLLFSDVHHDLAAARRLVKLSAGVDVVIGAGDFASVHKHLEETIDVLSAIERPAVLVPGNNETFEALEAACAAAWSSARVCHGSGVEHDGTAFFGLGGGIPPTPWDWSFDVDEDTARRRLARCPEGAVLVLHSPPRGYLDGRPGHHMGSIAILETITLKRPRLAVCGHIHECWGNEAQIGETLLVNPGPGGRVVEI